MTFYLIGTLCYAFCFNTTLSEDAMLFMSSFELGPFRYSMLFRREYMARFSFDNLGIGTTSSVS